MKEINDLKTKKEDIENIKKLIDLLDNDNKVFSKTREVIKEKEDYNLKKKPIK